MLQQLPELAGRHGDQRKTVVKAQGVFDIQGGNATCQLAGGGVGGCWLLLTRDQIDRADLGTDATTVLEREHHGGIDGFGIGEVGIGGEVAQIGFLPTHQRPLPFEVHAAVAPHLAVLATDHRLGRFGEILYVFSFCALCEGGAGQVRLTHIPDMSHIGRRGGVGTADERVNAAGEDTALGIKIHHQTAQISVFIVGIDDQGWSPICTLAHQGIATSEVGGMAREGHGLIIGIAQARIGPCCQNDVNASQQWCQGLLIGELLEVGHQDHLVHPLGGEIVDHRLQLAGKQLHVIALAAIAGKALHLNSPRGGNLLQQLGSRSHQTDLLAILDHNSRGSDPALQGYCLLKACAGSGIGEARVEIRITTELQVGGEVGELSSHPTAHRARHEGIAEHAGAEIKLVVANGGGLHTDQVMNGDVHRRNRMVDAGRETNARAGDSIELITHTEIRTAVEEGTGDEVIATGQN